jgi:glycosyltransferase involved in cell wall biosynthesis
MDAEKRDDEQRGLGDPLKILAVSYLCEPGRGSERGAGWGMVRALGTHGRCTVVTAPESAGAIRRWNAVNSTDAVNVLEIHEPPLSSLMKRTRVGEFLVYLGWQRRALRTLRKLPLTGRFDVACHASLSAYWLPAMATSLGIPSIWGPVGGAVVTPRGLWPLLGRRGVFVELADLTAVRLMSLYPPTRRTARMATVRVVQNDETATRLPRNARGTTILLNHAIYHEIDSNQLAPPEPDRPPYVAWVSPMESRKGPELAIRAFANTPDDLRLVMVGDGPELVRMQSLASSLGVDGRITFTGRVPHDIALATMRDAAVAVFTGLREEGGLALAEAMLLGTRTVVLGHGGAAVIARTATDPGRISIVEAGGIEQTITAMGRAIEDQYRRSAARSTDSDEPLIDAAAAVERLGKVIRGAVDRHAEGAA